MRNGSNWIFGVTLAFGLAYGFGCEGKKAANDVDGAAIHADAKAHGGKAAADCPKGADCAKHDQCEKPKAKESKLEPEKNGAAKPEVAPLEAVHPAETGSHPG